MMINKDAAKIKTTVMLVTPSMALAWLDKNTHNRDISQEAVNRYARDMAMGRWMLNHQGIAFAVDGTVLDGQHRLWAIAESKKTILMQVTTGLPLDAQLSIDGHRTRSTRDVLALRDRRTMAPEDGGDKHKAKKLPTETVGVAKLIAEQSGQPKPSRQETIDCYDLYKQSINRAVELFPRRVVRIQNAHTVCVITRAIECKVPIDELSRFVHILIEGKSPDAEQARDETVRLLRNSILEPRHLPRRSDTYKKMERALAAYLDNEKLKTIYPAPEEVFPLKGGVGPTLKISASVRRRRGAAIPVKKGGAPKKPVNATAPLLPPIAASANPKKFTNQPRLIPV